MEKIHHKNIIQINGGIFMDDNRVIMIRGNQSQWYDQAIFILKKDAKPSTMPVSIVREAEKIINDYMVKHTNKLSNIAQKAYNDVKPPQTQKRPAPPPPVSKGKNTASTIFLQFCLITSIFLVSILLFQIFAP